MLVHPIIDKLQSLRFFGMRTAFEEQLQTPDIDQLNFEERMGLLVDREMIERQNRRFKTRLTKAKLRQHACVEDVDFRHKRGLDKPLFMQLTDCQWIKEAHNVLIIGPTGVGKTYLACRQVIGDGPSQAFKINAKLFQETAEIHPILRFPASKITI